MRRELKKFTLNNSRFVCSEPRTPNIGTRTAGFTLTEVVVASALLIVTVVPILKAFTKQLHLYYLLLSPAHLISYCHNDTLDHSKMISNTILSNISCLRCKLLCKHSSLIMLTCNEAIARICCRNSENKRISSSTF